MPKVRVYNVYVIIRLTFPLAEYEIKNLVNEYDKVARKTVARIKKGRDEQLYSRHQILS